MTGHDTDYSGQWPHWIDQDWSEIPSDDPNTLEVWGYTGKLAYQPGETLDLHVSTTAGTYGIDIFRDGAKREKVYAKHGLPGEFHRTPANCYETGCDWPVGHRFEIPRDWKSGGYVITFTARKANKRIEQHGFFLLRPMGIGTRPVALVAATSTWTAYNDWGGASHYSLAGSAGSGLGGAQSPFAPRLSIERPWARGLIRRPVGAPRIPVHTRVPPNWSPRRESMEWAFATGHSKWSAASGWAMYEAPFVRWAERQGYEFDYFTQHDLHFREDLLNAYRCVVTCGHDEYWSHEMRTAVDRFVAGGGYFARFGGNFVWQIRFEDGGRVQVCYKYTADQHDPLRDDPQCRHLLTNAWESRSVNRPGVTTVAVNGLRGVYGRFGGASPRGSGGFTVYRPEHWAFQETDLYYGDVFGSAVPLVGYECDGLNYSFEYGIPLPTGEDGAPTNGDLRILAMAPVTLGEEHHGHFGTILSVGDADETFAAQALYGSAGAENRRKVRYGSAMITEMSKGDGVVFCAGTTEWPAALDQGNYYCDRITRNVLNRFTGT